MHKIRKYVVLLALLIGASAVYANNALELQFLWNEANSQMSSAKTKEEFLLATATYNKLVNAGVYNEPLFYNLGTAFLKAEQYDEAIKNLLRAERYMGSNWEIRRNMLIATAKEKKDETASLPWYRVPLFWHYGLACSARITITICAFAAFWLSLILKVLKFRRIYKSLMIFSLIVLVLFGSSVLTTIHQEAISERRNSERKQI